MTYQAENRMAENGPAAAVMAVKACSLANVSDEAIFLAGDIEPTDAFLFQLIERRMYHDAICVLPHILPIRQAVWFACLCAWRGEGSNLAPQQDQALRAAVRWVIDPSAEHHGIAAEAADAATWKLASGRCAAAVSYAGFRGDPADGWKTAKVDDTARLCMSAALKVANNSDRDQVAVLSIGVEIALGKNLWASQ